MCADYLALGRQIDEMDSLDVFGYHIDVMDGHFVPNYAFNPDMVAAVRTRTSTPLIVHLMCDDPEANIPRFAELGVEYVVFHIEATHQAFKMIELIRRTGAKPGVAINPATPVGELSEIIGAVAIVTMMTIEPGFAGQQFMPHSYARIAEVRRMLDASGSAGLIEIDGGINPQNGRRSLDAGADILVGGYFSVFRDGMSIPESYTGFLSEIANFHEERRTGETHE